MDDDYMPPGFKKIEDTSEEHVVFLTVEEMRALVQNIHPKSIIRPEDGYLIWKAFKKFEPILKDADA